MPGLAALFGLTALLYAAVGFGGGSTYTALLLLGGVAVGLVPAISLACNVVVVTGGTIRFARAGVMPWAKALPLIVVAAPLAFLGGLTPVKQGVLVILLGVSLLASAIALLFQPQTAKPVELSPKLLLPIAATIGYLAGVVGIGGGIFLAPILHLIRWAEARSVAATASLFILVNSLFGLTGQLIKGKGAEMIDAVAGHWPLLVAVLIGGAVGTQLAVKTGPATLIRRLTALLVGFVALRLLFGF
ncbi:MULTISPECIES: sulfite exporter TauE/SafE family protein [unclassified Sphingopyxis]|uniref:sulfite exporter TauE/SafE family protein n=1 Tax=unclassified Sphingopyxis TaxID=2614943 RepID=UPI0007310722|nr:MULTISPECIES: sulfite exporter TauE/SafE family protein [unclassified Sphingopyxis]MBD3733851.1 sulfite exporter TauE/SafE family protein [Sphingopyxis sp.]KTE28035.1 sulfoacetate transporter [Sphingopyxis sp. H057]KTE55587.1 sulfoacetate transporter [Sphingopyxis sp. H073]KTE57531.1 sulfoacetate transporter [Sphingopyxis sp. H071]KTE58023.1 sulfoacetate transporter [Sphingopyxis sp. H107]